MHAGPGTWGGPEGERVGDSANEQNIFHATTERSFQFLEWAREKWWQLWCQELMPKDETITVSFSLKMPRPAKKELDKMNKTRVQKIYNHIEPLKREPFRSSPGMNIDKVAGKQKPPAYLLKIGRIRVEYFVDGQMIVIFNIFMKKRKSDYR